ncbi:hypothetical protein M569_17571 [Genlisea aurea]|uniref:Uncharacterized protein n=1 Tax=Genlisea aurea TaxID=192259 RepID=S8BRJ3_9LAMI|nr:hypothetical protein M569_17571 [Genlisea aurea]
MGTCTVAQTSNWLAAFPSLSVSCRLYWYRHPRPYQHALLAMPKLDPLFLSSGRGLLFARCVVAPPCHVPVPARALDFLPPQSGFLASSCATLRAGTRSHTRPGCAPPDGPD